jgi:predicted ribosomally synthesized peptide with nif11-like leader
MSLENAKRFLETAAKDQTLKQKLAAAGPEDLVRIVIQAGSERGLPFTPEELQASMGPQPRDGGVELSDDQLGSVAGGIVPRASPSAIQDLLSRFFQPDSPPSQQQEGSLSHEPLHGRS